MAATHPCRQQVIADFKAKISFSKAIDEGHGIYMPPGPPPQKRYPPCEKALEQLKPMLVSQMKLQKHHRGRMLTVRACTAPDSRLSAIVTVVEDRDGTAVPLFFYNMHTRSATRPESILPKGTILLIKEPFLKLKQKTNTPFIRVDHATDVVFLPETDNRVPDSWKKSSPSASSAEIRLEGNLHVKTRDWSSALESYSTAIDLADTSDERELALVNRSLVNLRLGRYEAVLSDYAQIADPAAPNLKALFRAATAHYGLQDFSKCRDTLLQLLAAFPKEPSAQSLLARAEARLHERSTGQYSFASMYEQAKKPSGLVDCASFYGPVEVRESPGRGRGLFLTKAISVGDLILCEKASAFWRRPLPEYMGLASMAMHIQGLDMNPEEKRELSTQIQQKLLHTFETSRPILDLFASTGDSQQNIAMPGADGVFDSFLVNSIIDSNAASCPALFPGHASESDNHCQVAVTDYKPTDCIPPSNGLWLKASYLNHSCFPNCARVFVGDAVIVRAARDLAAGTELTVAYALPENFETVGQVQRRLSCWGFRCACGLCEARQRVADGAASQRSTIVGDIGRIPGHAAPANAELLARLCDEIDARYPSYAGTNQAPCIEMWQASFRRRAALEMLKRGPMDIVNAIAAALRGAGFVVSHSRDHFEIEQWGMLQPRLPKVLGELHEAYRKVNPQVCPAIKKYARTAFLVMTGEDETFGKMFPTLAEA